MTETQKKLVDDLRIQWKKLWQERVDDKVRAEGIAKTDFSSLFVEQGTIIHATRDFKALSFKEIVEKHKIENSERFIQPSPQAGGWSKFIKTELRHQKPQKAKRAELYCQEKKEIQQSKKSGRGWLHV